MCAVIILQSFPPAMPYIIPSIVPARTSVGKCTVRYIRDTAISAASITRITPFLRSCVRHATAPAKDADEWPDGNEKSVGAVTSRLNDGSTQNGRGLITRGLIIMLVKINEKTSER